MNIKQAKGKIYLLDLDQTTKSKVINILESVQEAALKNVIESALDEHKERFPFEVEENKERYYWLSGFLNSLRDKDYSVHESKMNHETFQNRPKSSLH